MSRSAAERDVHPEGGRGVAADRQADAPPGQLAHGRDGEGDGWPELRDELPGDLLRGQADRADEAYGDRVGVGDPDPGEAVQQLQRSVPTGRDVGSAELPPVGGAEVVI